MHNPNPFVYRETYDADVRAPTIASLLPEQYAQCGEDLIVFSLLCALKTGGLLDEWDNYICVEIGANHGFGGSNTYLIGKRLHIRSLLIEANPDLIPDLKKARPDDTVLNLAVVDNSLKFVDLYVSRHCELSSLDKEFVDNWHQGQVGVKDVCKVPAMRVNELFSAHIPDDKKILYLSIDVEGLDFTLVKDINFNIWRPLIIQMEPSEHYMPGEGERMISYMNGKNYVLLAKTDVNLIFADRSLVKRLAGLEPSESSAPSVEREPEFGVAAKQAGEAPQDGMASETKDFPHTIYNACGPAVEMAGKKPEVLGREPVAAPAARKFDVLSTWQLDESFLQSALQRAEAREVVSLDIFDTALTRCYDSPVDAFAEVERRLVAQFGRPVSGFALAREQAERNARERHRHLRGAEEITFKDIYAGLPGLLPKFRHWDLAAETELAVEREALCAVPDILELTKRLAERGQRFIFVSDMYLPGTFLAEILTTAGYAGWDRLYVSSETQCTKASGRVWDLVCRDYPGGILHVGDDAHADVHTPGQKGVETLEYARAVSERRTAARLTPAVLPFSRFRRHLDLVSRRLPGKPVSHEEAWRDLGRSLGGIVLGTFVRWLAERVQAHGIERLYFCARDGYLVQKAWEVSGLAQEIPVETRYLCVSRAALNIPTGVLESTPEKLSSGLLELLSSSLGKTTVRQALERANLMAIEDLVHEVRQEFGSLDTLLKWPETGRFADLLQRHAPSVYAALAGRHEIVADYLRQEGLLAPGKQAMVDMGWHGTLQSSLCRLIRHAGGASGLAGFYYGLWPAANRNRFTAGLMEACFASPFISWQAQSEMHMGVPVLEQLHSAPHGTTQGYRQGANGRIEPVFGDNPLEAKQYETKTRLFQEGALEAVRALFRGGEDPCPLEAGGLTPGAAIAALGAVILSPSHRELELLCGIGHCATFDHGSHEPVLHPELPADAGKLRELFLRSEWQPGQLRLWWPRANEAQKALLKTLIAEHLSYLGERALRPFA